jgi:DamX protein
MSHPEEKAREGDIPGDDRLRRYGLQEQPFRETPDAAFIYTDPVIDTYLALLLDRLHAASQVLLLTADRGGGKSTLLMRMLMRGQQDLAFCAFKAKPGTTFNAIENTLLRCWRSEDDGPGVGSVEELICRHLSGHRRPTLVIDDAHCLGADTLRAIAGMRRSVQQRCGQSPGVLLAGEPRLASLVDEVADDGLTLGPAIHLELRPLTLEQTEAYLRHRLVAGGAPDPGLLSGAQAVTIHRESRGLPLLINHSANRHLQGLHGEADPARSAQESSTEKPRKAWQVRKGLGLGVLGILGMGAVAVVALSLFWLLPREAQEALSETTAPPEFDTADAADWRQYADSAPRFPKPADREVESLGERSPERADESVDVLQEPPPVPDRADPQQFDPLKYRGEADFPAQIDPPSQASQPEYPNLSDAPAPDESQENIATAPPLLDAPIDPETARVPEAEVQEDAPDPRGDVTVPMAAESQANGPVMLDAQWLRQQTRSDFTVQLAASGNLERLRGLSESLPETLERAWFAVERDGRPWFSLVAGSYSDSASAQASISRLPAEIRGNKPWIRTFASIQDVLESSSDAAGSPER